MRVNINNTRSSLLTLLQSDYYQHLLLAEFNDYADRLHGFKGELITHDTMLAREPRARDADIVLFYQKRIDLDQYFEQDRKSTRLNSSHVRISYAVFCLKKRKT